MRKLFLPLPWPAGGGKRRPRPVRSIWDGDIFSPVTRPPRGEAAQRLSDPVVSHDPVDGFVNSQSEALAPQHSTRLVSRARALHWDENTPHHTW